MSAQPRLLCSTGAFTHDPDQTDYRAILTYGPALAVDGLELLFYPDWYPHVADIAADLRASGLRFPAIHAEMSIGPALGSDQPEARALGLQRLTENCRLGAGLLILHLWGLPGSDEHLGRNLDALTACLTIAADEGLTVAVETIPCVRADPLGNVRRALDRSQRRRRPHRRRAAELLGSPIGFLWWFGLVAVWPHPRVPGCSLWHNTRRAPRCL
jgi:sugar phosphate isomerase/epimerase